MQAIILAGGLAERLYPLTKDKPKWLLPLGNGTIADYQLEWLKKNGITEVFVTVNRKHSETVLTQPYETEININFIHEEKPIGDEGGLKRAMDYVQADEVYVVNCDIITDLPLWKLPLTPSLALVHPRSPWGIFRDDGVFEEKPILPIWVSGGIYKFPRAIKEELIDKGNLAQNIVPKLIREGRMAFFKYSGQWQAVETAKDLKSLKGGEE